MQKEGIPGEEGQRGSAKGEPREGGGGVGGEGMGQGRTKTKVEKKDAFPLSNICVKPFQEA